MSTKTTASALAQATALAQAGPGAFTGDIPDGWQQGKGAFGGVSVALLTRALIASEPDRARTLRSFTAELCAPVMTGPVEVRVTTLRRGASASFLDAQLVQEGAVVARGSAALAASRAVAPAGVASPAPSPKPWTDAPVIPVEPPLGPVFARHYEYRLLGPLPFSGAPEAIAEGWIREKQPPEALDEAAIAALLDAWWPTALTVAPMPRPAATVAFTMQLLTDPRALPPSEPLYYRARGVASYGSFVVELRELWSGDQIVAMNQQTFALLG